MAGSHGNKTLKSLLTSPTVYHTYPNYPIGPALWTTVSAVIFSLKVKRTWIILADPGWVIQAQYCSELVHVPLFPPRCQSALTMTNHTKGKGHGFIPKFPGVPLRSLSVPRHWIGPGPSDHPKRHVPHTDTSPITSAHNCFICQWEGLWPNESLWHPPKTHNDFSGIEWESLEHSLRVKSSFKHNSDSILFRFGKLTSTYPHFHKGE